MAHEPRASVPGPQRLIPQDWGSRRPSRGKAVHGTVAQAAVLTRGLRLSVDSLRALAAGLLHWVMSVGLNALLRRGLGRREAAPEVSASIPGVRAEPGRSTTLRVA